MFLAFGPPNGLRVMANDSPGRFTLQIVFASLVIEVCSSAVSHGTLRGISVRTVVSTAHVRTRDCDHSFSDVTIRVLVLLTNAHDAAMLGKGNLISQLEATLWF